MTIDKNNEGAWRICENINGYLETQVYYFYTKKDAIKKFREYNCISGFISLYNRNICSVCIQAGLRPDDNTHDHGLRTPNKAILIEFPNV